MNRRLSWSLLCALGVSAIHAVSASGGRFDPSWGVSGGPTDGGRSCSNCHGYEEGEGSVAIIGAPGVYELDTVYDMIVRIEDPLRFGAGFEFSAETTGGLVGALILTDEINTQLMESDTGDIYIAQTNKGVSDSTNNWKERGSSVDYTFQWRSPSEYVGPIRMYAAACTIDDDRWFTGDLIYLASVTLEVKVDGDGDDDADADFADYAGLQDCFDETPLSEYCQLFDLDPTGAIDLSDYNEFLLAVTGPTARGPSAYRHADAVRGGRLYDTWWVENDAAEPVGDHPLYPPKGQQKGSTTFRCQECHGWDYKGADGAYGIGSDHYTGIMGVWGTSLSAGQIFDLLKSDSPPAGHDMDNFGLTDGDIWDLIKFLFQQQVDTDLYIDEFGQFLGNPLEGSGYYVDTCEVCHGDDGTWINFGTKEDPIFLGTIANERPWEFFHRARSGQPRRPMPSLINLWYSDEIAVDVSAYAATLRTK